MYSTWFDVFNLIQLGIQALALLEGLLEHRLIKQNREAESLLLNKHWAIFIICGAYPVVTISILLYGAGMHLVAYALAAVSLPAMTVVAITSFRRKSLAGKVHRRKLAKLLSETGFDSDGFEELFEQSFNAFDLDKSGFLEADEIRTLLKAVFGKDKALYSTAIEITNKNLSASGGLLSLSACQDVFTTLELAGHRGRGESGAGPPAGLAARQAAKRHFKGIASVAAAASSLATKPKQVTDILKFWPRSSAAKSHALGSAVDV